jgi:hypothetical protein
MAGIAGYNPVSSTLTPVMITNLAPSGGGGPSAPPLLFTPVVTPVVTPAVNVYVDFGINASRGRVLREWQFAES